MTDSQPGLAQTPTPQVIAERLGRLMDEADELRSLAALSRHTGIDRASLSQKLHGRRRWYLDEVIAVARALGTSVAYLIGETSSPTASAPLSPEEDPALYASFFEGEELSRRLAFLQKTSVATSSEQLPSGHPFTEAPDRLEALLHLTTPVRLPRALLESLAHFFRVPSGYLLVLDNPDSAERVEAEVDFERVIHDSGIQRVATRSLASLSASEIRALTQALRK